MGCSSLARICERTPFAQHRRRDPVWQGLLGQFVQWAGQSGEAPETTSPASWRWGRASPEWWPSCSPGVGRSASDLVPQVGRLLQPEVTFGWVGGEPRLPQLPQLPEVDIPAGTVDDDIIDVDSGVGLVRPQELIHHPLEGSQGSVDAEGEDSVLVQPPWGRKRCLLPGGVAPASSGTCQYPW